MLCNSTKITLFVLQYEKSWNGIIWEEKNHIAIGNKQEKPRIENCLIAFLITCGANDLDQRPGSTGCTCTVNISIIILNYNSCLALFGVKWPNLIQWSAASIIKWLQIQNWRYFISNKRYMGQRRLEKMQKKVCVQWTSTWIILNMSLCQDIFVLPIFSSGLIRLVGLLQGLRDRMTFATYTDL